MPLQELFPTPPRHPCGLRKEWKKNVKKFESKKTSKTAEKLRTKSFGLLTLFAAEIGLPRIAGYGAGKVGGWIKDFEEQSQKKAAFELWSKSAKTKLTKLINHNKHDVEATQFVLEYLLR